MSGKRFVDTSILVYAHDRTAGAKHQRARALLEELWQSGDGVLSTQVLEELCVNLRQKAANPLPADEVRRMIREYSTWEVVTNGDDSVVQALDLGARHRISFREAMLLQAALHSGALVLYSEALCAGQKYGAIQVINPLADL